MVPESMRAVLHIFLLFGVDFFLFYMSKNTIEITFTCKFSSYILYVNSHYLGNSLLSPHLLGALGLRMATYLRSRWSSVPESTSSIQQPCIIVLLESQAGQSRCSWSSKDIQEDFLSFLCTLGKTFKMLNFLRPWRNLSENDQIIVWPRFSSPNKEWEMLFRESRVQKYVRGRLLVMLIWNASIWETEAEHW